MLNVDQSLVRGDWRPLTVQARPERPLKVRLLREAGGLGDVLCCLPPLKFMYENFAREGLTARGLELLAAQGGSGTLGEPCELVLYGFGPYHKVWDMAGIPYTWRSQMHNDRPGRRLR